MEMEWIMAFLVGALIPTVLYLYNRYEKITDVDSDGGEAVTWDELVETFSDAQFWEHIDAVKDAIDDMDEQE